MVVRGAAETYSESDWDAENAALLAGAAPEACPSCGRTGFYGPRRASPEEKYRACAFCGFAQEVGKPAVRWIPTVHGCDPWPEVAGAPHIEWVPRDRVTHACPFCGTEVQATTARLMSPADDPSHPWWRVPQGCCGTEYLEFWREKIDPRLPLRSRLYL